jgi:hypothetical protein
LLGEVARLVEEARRVPSLLARPVRIVVPSRSLREHVAGRIVAELGHAVAGVEVSSLRGLAFDLLRRAGGSAPGGDALFPIVVRQQARLEPVLRSVLDPLEDGYGSVVATLSDLLDSGFELAHVEALDECLADAASGAAVERGRAVVRTAARTLEALEEAGLEHRSGLFRRAREAVQSDPSAVLPARAVLIHGFADATGVQLELLEAVVAAAPLPHPSSTWTARMRRRTPTGPTRESSSPSVSWSASPAVGRSRSPTPRPRRCPKLACSGPRGPTPRRAPLRSGSTSCCEGAACPSASA